MLSGWLALHEEEVYRAWNLAVAKKPFGKIAPLADSTVLSTFSIDHGVLTWLEGEIDIAPEGLYLRTYEYPEAEEMIA